MMLLTPTQRPANAVVGSFLEALARRDFEALAECFAPNVWMRALLTRRLHESTTAEGAVAAYREWFGGAPAFEVLFVEQHTMAEREYLAYRVRLRPDWAPDQWHVIEQVGFCRVKDGRITRLDLSCSGFFPSD